MDKEELEYCAKYPFTQKASEKVLKNFNIDKIRTQYIEKAQNRLENALRDQDDPKKHRRMIENAKTSTNGEEFLEKEVVSYPLAKVTAALTNNRYIRKKVANNEAKKTKHYLDMADPNTVENIAKEALEIHLDEDTYKIPVKNYLEKKPKKEEYKLVNMPLKKGYVHLTQNHLTELVAQYVYTDIMYQKAPKNPPIKLTNLSQDIKNKINTEHSTEDYGTPKKEAFPPCMDKIYQDLLAGKDVGHQARFVLATFMVNIGMEMDEMIKPYRGQPNFDEEKTKYFLRHAAGKEGTGTEYSAPSCDKLNSYRLCVSDCPTNHPLSYYKYQKKKMNKGDKENEKST